jgi:hypothetical protein
MQNKITEMTNNSEEQQTSSSTEETIIEVVIQPPTTEAKVECDAPPAVITTQPAQSKYSLCSHFVFNLYTVFECCLIIDSVLCYRCRIKLQK